MKLPNSPQEFYHLIHGIIDGQDDLLPKDKLELIEALTEITGTFCLSATIKLTPCQKLVGRAFIDMIEERIAEEQ